MTQSDILSMPADDYMNAAQLAFFEGLLRSKLADAVTSIEGARTAIAGLGVVPDAVDQASIEEERLALTRTLERLNAQIKCIKKSLVAISEESYGHCEMTGEEIGLQRLLAQPTARFSVAAQSQKEHIARHYLAA